VTVPADVGAEYATEQLLVLGLEVTNVQDELEK
jgi:hypothetical protein